IAIVVKWWDHAPRNLPIRRFGTNPYFTQFVTPTTTAPIHESWPPGPRIRIFLVAGPPSVPPTRPGRIGLGSSRRDGRGTIAERTSAEALDSGQWGPGRGHLAGRRAVGAGGLPVCRVARSAGGGRRDGCGQDATRSRLSSLRNVGKLHAC